MPVFRIQMTSQVIVKVLDQQFRALVYVSTKHGFLSIQVQPHVDVLSASSGKHKNHRPVIRSLIGGECSFGFQALQGENGVLNVATDHCLSVIEYLSA